MQPDFQLIRFLAEYAQRAYQGATVYDRATDAQATVAPVNLPDGKPGIVVAFRGSSAPLDFIHDAECWMSDLVLPTVEQDVWACVHHGFLIDFNAITVEVIRQVKLLLNAPGSQPAKIYLTGHSLGGALAILCGLEFAKQKLPLAQVVTFGQPRVGDAEFAQYYDDTLVESPCLKLRDITSRVVNQNDIVPRTPGCLQGYRHCGQEIFLSSFGGWRANPTLLGKALSDAFGFWQAYSNRADVLIREHFMSAYREKISNL